MQIDNCFNFIIKNVYYSNIPFGSIINSTSPSDFIDNSNFYEYCNLYPMDINLDISSFVIILHTSFLDYKILLYEIFFEGVGFPITINNCSAASIIRMFFSLIMA